jgi:hypothetical protein
MMPPALNEMNFGGRSSLYRLESLTSDFIRSSSVSSRTPKSLTSSMWLPLVGRFQVVGAVREPPQQAFP